LSGRVRKSLPQARNEPWVCVLAPVSQKVGARTTDVRPLDGEMVMLSDMQTIRKVTIAVETDSGFEGGSTGLCIACKGTSVIRTN
jgi:hypothetical protein